MADYMEPRESIGYWLGEDPENILPVLAGRYIGANPPLPFAFRGFRRNGILQTGDGMYDMDLTARLPEAGQGDYAYVFGLVWSDDERSLDTGIMPLGPIGLYVNERLLYRSSAVDELDPQAKAVVPLTLRRGWNTLLIEARRTEAGFGCRFGAEEAKVRILQVLAPFAERKEEAGWLYSEPTAVPLFGEQGNGAFPDYRRSEKSSGLRWLPAGEWSADRLARPNCERLFGSPDAGKPVSALAWSRLGGALPGERTVWEGRVWGATTLWLDGTPVLRMEQAGTFREEVTLGEGGGEVLVQTASSEAGWGFELDLSGTRGPIPLTLPAGVRGSRGPWLYAGPLAPDVTAAPAKAASLRRLFEHANGGEGAHGKVYWSLDAPGCAVRPFYENAMLSNKWTTGSATNFGRWDYPLGVTMYGLLRAAETLERKDIVDYAYRHITACTDFYDYALWDKEIYGFPSVNHQLVLIRMLDNCGSFGSAMLEAYKRCPAPDFLRIARAIADFIKNRLERRDDGAFYRLCPGEYAANTMWADDLYMSGPFLARYARAADDPACLDEAARQFLLFRRYLFMPEPRVMSHVFDFKVGKATHIPWGRGNGWTVFSLSEILEALPPEHKDRAELLDFFGELCGGIAALQGESGLWRQVLTEEDAYEEASCTAMFAYAFARGVRFGWLPRDGYGEAAIRAWRGLVREAIDRQGNVHGVCSGSRYSFTPDYYKYDLRTVINDNHGIGIMMLAGVEVGKMKECLALPLRDERGASADEK
ncbi:glycoside hydrolase family 88/105 protein [Paenibacillus sp. A14]|uniref:glycoside hydrolase family 88/105 protein n=1 Tax=Paenibacillus sp. A14 TaxID=3119820 RepID=UPI002FDF61B2